MFALLNSVPFLGKHKRVVGGLATAVGGAAEALGQSWGSSVKDFGIMWMGLGIAHAGAKAKSG